MAVTITEQLAKLNSLKIQLAANLTTKGVSATATEKFNTLVPKVLEISSVETPTSAAISLSTACITAWQILQRFTLIFAVKRITTP